MSNDDDIGALAMRGYHAHRDGAVKTGTAAQDCAHRYLAHHYLRDNEEKQSLAYRVVNHCLDDLSATKRPAIVWLEEVGDGYTPSVGCDTPVTGYTDGDSIYINRDLHGQKLVEVVAHEVYHVVNHAKRDGFGPRDERDTIEYGRKVAAAWPDAGMRVVTEADRLGLSA